MQDHHMLLLFTLLHQPSLLKIQFLLSSCHRYNWTDLLTSAHCYRSKGEMTLRVSWSLYNRLFSILRHFRLCHLSSAFTAFSDWSPLPLSQQMSYYTKTNWFVSLFSNCWSVFCWCKSSAAAFFLYFWAKLEIWQTCMFVCTGCCYYEL